VYAQSAPPSAPNNLRVVGTFVNAPPTVGLKVLYGIANPGSVVVMGGVSDDGLPGPTLSTKWSLLSGPGTVSFSDDTTLTTSATFSADGIYTLRFVANDGALTTSKNLSVTATHTPAALPTLAIESLGVPIKSSRYWSNALAPNNRGGLILLRSSGLIPLRSPLNT